MVETLKEAISALENLDREIHKDWPLLVTDVSSPDSRPANLREQTVLYAFAAAMGMVEASINEFLGDPDRPLDSVEGQTTLLNERLHRYPFTPEEIVRLERWLTTGERLTTLPGEIPPSKFLQQQAQALLVSIPD